MRPIAALVLALVLWPAAPAHAIFHGAPVGTADAPWLVALTSRGVVCGGALIAPDRVLTAAHCVQGADPARLRVRLGGGAWTSARKLAWRGAVFPTRYRLIPSPLAPDNPFRSASADDVAVILLRSPVHDVAPLAVAADAPIAGEPTTTIGRGRTGPVPSDAERGGPVPDPGGTSRRPFAAVQSALDPAACASAYGTTLFVAADHLCTQDLTATAAQACAGDSGSPVLVSRGGAPAVAAVVTWGNETQDRDCGEGLPDVSERVLPHAALLAAPANATVAPWAERRVRVRRSGGTLRCVVGAWHPRRVRFTIRWWRPSAARLVTVPGTRATRRAGRQPLGCSVTARTSGGWASEDSYNAR